MLNDKSKYGINVHVFHHGRDCYHDHVHVHHDHVLFPYHDALCCSMKSAHGSVCGRWQTNIHYDHGDGHEWRLAFHVNVHIDFYNDHGDAKVYGR